MALLPHQAIHGRCVMAMSPRISFVDFLNCSAAAWLRVSRARQTWLGWVCKGTDLSSLALQSRQSGLRCLYGPEPPACLRVLTHQLADLRQGVYSKGRFVCSGNSPVYPLDPALRTTLAALCQPRTRTLGLADAGQHGFAAQLWGLAAFRR